MIRWLYDRPLETLLATFGVSIALQQIAKNVFGTQARPPYPPGRRLGHQYRRFHLLDQAIFVLSAVGSASRCAPCVAASMNQS